MIELSSAVQRARAVLALESSVWAQGLPRPVNLEVAREACARCRDEGVEPAIITLREGKIRIGLDDRELEALCSADQVVKVGLGEIPSVLARGELGATTVSCTLVAAELAGIRVMSTGGLGAAHLDWCKRPDISADLGQLARTRVLTVCSGLKSVLDFEASVEMLETLGVPICLFATDLFPRFYTEGVTSGMGVRADTVTEVAQTHRCSLATLGRGLLVMQACPPEFALNHVEVERWVHEGMLIAEEKGQLGKRLTPFLLGHLAQQSEGRTLKANRALLLENVTLGARLARELANG